jgi:hypothetical protein
MIDDHRNIQTIIDRFAGIADLLDPHVRADQYLCYIGLERFALSLLTMASEVADRDVHDVERQSHFYLFGGSLALRERQHIIGLLNRISGKKSEVFQNAIRLEPPYFEELIEIVNRLIRNAREASTIPHHIDAVIYCCMTADMSRIEPVLSKAFSTDAIVLAKRIAKLFQKSAGISQEMFKELIVR